MRAPRAGHRPKLKILFGCSLALLDFWSRGRAANKIFHKRAKCYTYLPNLDGRPWASTHRGAPFFIGCVTPVQSHNARIASCRYRNSIWSQCLRMHHNLNIPNILLSWSFIVLSFNPSRTRSSDRMKRFYMRVYILRTYFSSLRNS